MKLSPSVLALALPLAASASLLEKRASMYDGYKVFQIEAGSDYDAITEAVSKLQAVTLGCEERHDHIDVAIAPQDVAALEALGFDLTLVRDDLGADLRLEGEAQAYIPAAKTSGFGIAASRQGAAAPLPDFSWFDSYHVFEDHLAWLEDMQAAFPDNSEVFVAGYSLEGRPIQGIHLYGRDGPGHHRAIIWHGTVHAREWITAPTVEYMTYKLVEGYLNRTCTSKRALDNYDFYVMPVVNPDGFVYTHTSNRLWRKNRQARPNATCIGTDVNRNWPHQWAVPGGSSTNPCSETFRGLAPGDTPEMAVLTNHTMALSSSTGIKLYVDWHSYSQLLLLPYGYSCDAVAENNDYQMALAGGVAAEIEAVNGLDFVYGPTCPTIYQTSGVSMDFAYDIAKAELSWGFEMRPATSGQGGFVIPPSNIIPSGEEQWAGMKYLLANF